MVSIAQVGCYANKLAALEAIGYLAENSPDQMQDVIPVLVNLLSHSCDAMKDSAAGTLWSVMMSREDYPRAACEHGCIPKLLDNLRRRKYVAYKFNFSNVQMLFYALEKVSEVTACHHVALQHGIVPLMLELLHNKITCEDQDCALNILECFTPYLLKTLARSDQRHATIRLLVSIAREGFCSTAVSARRLLERMIQDTSLGHVVQEAGYA